MHHRWIVEWAVLTGLVRVSLALAIVSGPPQELLDRGYTWLTQARLATAGAAREGLLREALATFKEAYQNAGPSTQVHALVGAAQAYLLVQSPRRVFPFLWQATPLQRAERSLQQALFLHPQNAAAALLLGMVYWRQAATASELQTDTLARSRHYLEQAASLGVPVHLPTASAPGAEAATMFGVDDSMLALEYVDARGSGTLADLVLIYRPAESPRVFGVVVTAGKAYPLTMGDTTSSAPAPASRLAAMTVTPQPGSAPVLALRFQYDTRQVAARFTWDGARFVPLPALP